jgi:endonuclease/exonuclease/phosphatase family metal-dependent hydrolase
VDTRIRKLDVVLLLGLIVPAPGCRHSAPSGESAIDSAQEDSDGPDVLGEVPFGAHDTLDVVTWNIETFPKNGRATVDAVAQILHDLDADLFALQEISDVDAFEQMVAQMPGWVGYVESAWYGGLAYLYRRDVIELRGHYEIYTTEAYWAAFPRSPQVMVFQFGNQEFVVINNHLKCCGDGLLDQNDSWDEETRRMDATNLLKEYVDTYFPQSRVMILGDLNDSLTDAAQNNVFMSVLDDPEHYAFADMGIAEGDAAGWSYPSYPSHLDHILITNELFDYLEHEDADVVTLPVDDMFFDGWSDYEATVSDHRPVALRVPLGD